MATGSETAPRRIDPRAVKIGEHLRFLRERRHLTQEAMADGLGLKTTAAYQHYETGRALPGMARVPVLAGLLGVPTCELFPDSVVPAVSRHPASMERPAEPQPAVAATLSPTAQKVYDAIRAAGLVPEDQAVIAANVIDFLEWQRSKAAGERDA